MTMFKRDILSFAWSSLNGYRSRTLLMLLAMSISVASVLLLTALGDGARRYVLQEFTSLGTNLVIVLPGKSETSGAGLSMMGITPRDLTLSDASALTRNASITNIAPLNIGAVEASWQNRKRQVTLMGSTTELLAVRQWEMGSGDFLPATEWDRAASVCVIGRKIRDELFGSHNALGQWIRLADNRYRVIGVMASTGRSIGVDVQEVVIVPIAAAQSLLNTEGLFRILIQTKNSDVIPSVIEFIEQTIQQRHHGVKDITVITQDAVIKTFDSILSALTYALGAIAAISLGVAGILIMNVMLVAVSQRTAEIGLLKAIGASRNTILILILSEALLLSMLGALFGFIIGGLGSWGLSSAVENLQVYPPLWALIASLIVALITGLVFSLIPARKAARMDPVNALQGH
jgi:putative ABC transport system permease protein